MHRKWKWINRRNTSRILPFKNRLSNLFSVENGSLILIDQNEVDRVAQRIKELEIEFPELIL